MTDERNTRTRGQRGRAQATIDLIATCIEIIEPCQPISVRGVAYKLFAAGYIDSMAVKNTQKISGILRQAREEGLIPWEWIVDESREMERQPHWSDLQGYAKSIENSYRRDFWSDQKNRPIVISEKSTVSGIIRPALEEYGIPFFSAHGFNSATKVHELAEQIQRDPRTHVFLYVGDRDPSGMFMSEEDFPDRLQLYGASTFTFERIALTADDVVNLPSFPAKPTDPRYSWYSTRYGSEAWELDAMDPQVLRERVENAILRYVDDAAWSRHKIVEAAERVTTKELAATLASMRGEA